MNKEKTKKPSAFRIVLGLISVVILIGSCYSICTFPDSYPEIEQRGYLRDLPVRVQSFYTSTDDFSVIREHARNRPWTEGGVTHAFYFNDSLNTPNVTKVGIQFSKKYEKYCIAAYHKIATGKEIFQKYPFKN